MSDIRSHLIVELGSLLGEFRVQDHLFGGAIGAKDFLSSLDVILQTPGEGGSLGQATDFPNHVVSEAITEGHLALNGRPQEKVSHLESEERLQIPVGRTAYRPQFREMISLARRPDRPFGMILTYKYSRFARSREDSIVHKALLKKSGTQLVSITELVDDTAMGRLMQAIIECIDEFYSENIGEEVPRGMRESVSRGFYVCSRPPYGYRVVKVNDGGKMRNRLELDEYQSRVVFSCFDKILIGGGLTEIVRDLSQNAVAGPKAKGCTKTSLRKILGKEIYTGTLV